MKRVFGYAMAVVLGLAFVAPDPIAAVNPSCQEGSPGWVSIATANPKGTFSEGVHTFRIDYSYVDFDGTSYSDFMEGTFLAAADADHQPGAVWLVPWNTGMRVRTPKHNAGFVEAIQPGQNAEFALGFVWLREDPVYGEITRQMVHDATDATIQTVSLDGAPALPMHYGAVLNTCVQF